MREIVFDTETTGLDCLNGDRLIEIGCVELLNHIPTGRTYHTYLNPRRAVAAEAVQVHGLTDEFLRQHRLFEEVVDEVADFLADSMLVAHNASFDRGFMNMELERCRRSALAEHRFVDTLVLARRRHPNSPNSLDALCLRYGIDNTRRSKHGALVDAQILAEVYLELLGGRQSSLALASGLTASSAALQSVHVPPRPRRLPPRLREADLQAHAQLMATLGDAPIWSRFRQSKWNPARLLVSSD
jgi:DNA polymerase-3 subunit epsilon